MALGVSIGVLLVLASSENLASIAEDRRGVVGDALAAPVAKATQDAGKKCFGKEPTMIATTRRNNQGTGGNDVIVVVLRAANGPVYVNGEGGDDRICGGSTSDWLRGGPGSDRLWDGPGDSSSEFLYAGSGDDLIISANDDAALGQGGDDRIHGGDSADWRLQGGPGKDVIYGHGGNDRLGFQGSRGGGRGDRMIGGPGNDLISDDDNFGDDALSGGDGDDHLEGYRGDDRLLGQNGDDHLEGLGGDDRLRGQNGDDRLEDGSGSDDLDGGRGDDRFSVVSDNGSDVVVGGDGSDSVAYLPGYLESGVCISLDDLANDGEGCPADPLGDNVTSSIENIEGTLKASAGWTGFDDILVGGAGANVITADDGSDQLFGLAGDDVLAGGAGDDALDGGSDIDECRGDEGTDSAVNCETVKSVP